MGWMEAIGTAIQYIEEHITDELTVQMIADHVNISSFYFQKGFAMLCGFTISEYIRNRRLALAGNDLATGDERIFEYLMQTLMKQGKKYRKDLRRERYLSLHGQYFPVQVQCPMRCRMLIPRFLPSGYRR